MIHTRGRPRGRSGALGLLLALALVVGVAPPAAADGDHHHGHDPYAGCSDDHPATLDIVARVRYSLEHVYTDIVVLTAMGYHPYFDILVPGYTHWIKPQFIDDGVVLDPLMPESILVDHWNRPRGVMFIEESTEPGPPVYVNDDGTECYPWHPHTDQPARFGWMWYRAIYDGSWQDGSMEYPDQTPAMMHVWSETTYGAYAAHDYPPPSAPPGPLPSYLQDGTVEEVLTSLFAELEPVWGPIPWELGDSLPWDIFL